MSLNLQFLIVYWNILADIFSNFSIRFMTPIINIQLVHNSVNIINVYQLTRQLIIYLNKAIDYEAMQQKQKLDMNLYRQAYMNGKNNNATFQVLVNTFQLSKMINQNSRNPNVYNQQINKLKSSKLLPTLPNKQKSGPFPPDPKVSYPMNKPGALNTLERVCAIVDKGIQQRQDPNKPPKLTQIISFHNKIQSTTTKNNEKLEWVKDIKQYPFRIVVIDKDNKIKAIYFKTIQEAQNIRIYYICNYSYKGNFKKTMQQSYRKLAIKIAQNFKSHLIRFRNQKILKAKQQKSKSRISLDDPKSNKSIVDKAEDKSINKQVDRSMKDEPIMSKDRNSNVNNSSLNNQKGYSGDVLKSLIQKQKSRVSSQGKYQNIASKSKILQDGYKKNLFQTWLQKSRKSQAQSKKLPLQSNISGPSKQAGTSQPQTLCYKSIQFLRQSNILIKPILLISLVETKSGNRIVETKFNTIIRRKEPNLNYELIVNSGDEAHKMVADAGNYHIVVRAIDYLTNTEICNSKIDLKNKVLTTHTLLINEDKTARIQVQYTNSQNSNGRKDAGAQNKYEESPQGCFLDVRGLNQRYIEQIKQYWQKQSIRRGYYNISKDIKIIQILQLSEQSPKFWLMGIPENQFKLVCILNSASLILKFKLTQSILPILQILSKLYSQIDELIQVCLSIMTTYMRTYYMISELNRTNKLHTLLGLDEGEMELPAKIGLEIELISRILSIECPDFANKMRRRNIGYLHILYQYVYQMFAKNFALKILIQLWNFLFKDPIMVPVYMLLISIWLIKFYCQKLKRCRRFKQVAQILESHETCQADIIVRDVIILRQKYFNAGNKSTIIDSIKQMFNTKPLEQVVVQFYKRETERIDKRKQNRNIEKNVVLQKLSSQMGVELPKYPHRTYCLHIYFYTLPPVPGSLYIKANNIEYECMNLPKTRYFIVGDVGTQITLQFINNKSDEYSCKLQCMQGINRHQIQLQSNKDTNVYKVYYICGLLTQSYIDMLKKNRKFQHFLGPFIKREELFDQFLRPIQECYFLNNSGRRLDKDQLGKKIKVIFSTGSKNFDQIQFYLRWIYVSPITLPEKLKLIKNYASNISQQYFLSDCNQLQKIFLQIFLEMAQFHISPSQFESYYSDGLQLQFKAPKIAKCRLILPNGSQHKLEQTANKYLSRKSFTHLYGDIIWTELISQIQKQMESSLSNFTEGILKLIYSNYGEVRSVQIPIVKKKTSKDLIIDQNKYEFQIFENNDISTVEPEVLVTQVLPTFSKISTILDFVNNSKSIESLGKAKQPRNVPQIINLLKVCDTKFQKIIAMRYQKHPQQLNVPFLKYYHELMSDAVQPQFPKNVFLNNLQTDIKNICTYKGLLSFSDNKKIESTLLNKNFGLFGNLRILAPKTETLYFTTVLEEEKQQPNALLFINHGYGIFRWEPCIAIAYTYIQKDKQSNLNKQKRPKRSILVRHQRTQKFYKDNQLKIQPKILQNLDYIEVKSISSLKNSSIKKQIEMSGSRRQIGSISNKNIGSSQGRRNFNNL